MRSNPASDANRTAPAGAGSAAPTATVGTARTTGSQPSDSGSTGSATRPSTRWSVRLSARAISEAPSPPASASSMWRPWRRRQRWSSEANSWCQKSSRLPPIMPTSPVAPPRSAARDRVGPEADPSCLSAHARLRLGRDALAAQRIRHPRGREPRGFGDIAQGRSLASTGRLRHDVLIVSQTPGGRKWMRTWIPFSLAGSRSGCRPRVPLTRPASRRSPRSSPAGRICGAGWWSTTRIGASMCGSIATRSSTPGSSAGRARRTRASTTTTSRRARYASSQASSRRTGW